MFLKITFAVVAVVVVVCVHFHNCPETTDVK